MDDKKNYGPFFLKKKFVGAPFIIKFYCFEGGSRVHCLPSLLSRESPKLDLCLHVYLTLLNYLCGSISLSRSQPLFIVDTFKSNAQEDKVTRLLLVVPKVTQPNFSLTRVRPWLLLIFICLINKCSHLHKSPPVNMLIIPNNLHILERESFLFLTSWIPE